MKTYTSHSLEETREIAREWLGNIAMRAENGGNNDFATSQATIIGLSGHLGAGKTTFVKAVAKELGVEGEVTSPTFVIMKIYDLDPNFQFPISNFQSRQGDSSRAIDIPWKRLVHIDAYRLERAEELEVLNWEQLVADRNSLIMIEWPENVDLKNNENLELEMLKFEIEGGSYRIDVG